MKISDYSADNFRNLKGVDFAPDSGINVIFGENGQGKTNIMESIWLFTGCHSFRTHKHNELICTGKKEANVKISFDAHSMKNEASLKINTKREFTFNGIQRESPRKFLGEFQAVIFSPYSLSIIQNAPSERRRFLDIAISMVKPAYASYLIKYSKLLANRNALLKQISLGTAQEDFLLPWDEELSKVGAKITLYRLSYVDNLAAIAGEIYKEISGGKESMHAEYILSSKCSTTDEYELTEGIYMALQRNKSNDIRRLLTSIGPHKDDLSVNIDGLSSRTYGSQGQQRACALSLKLGESYIIKDITGDYPVILLDDVMSELDYLRQGYLMEYLKDRQVFITCCDTGHLSKLSKFTSFKIENGCLMQ